MKKLLALDLSTTSTGYAIFDIETKELITYDIIKASSAGLSKLTYPAKPLEKILRVADQIMEVIIRYQPDQIVIEEINRGTNRIGQKTLDILHGILWYGIYNYNKEMLNIITYIDSDGRDGWRTTLKLRLTDADKLNNRENKKLNKKLAKGTKKLPIITKKDLAQRFVNRYYHLTFDVQENTRDSDMVDAIGLGHVHLHF